MRMTGIAHAIAAHLIADDRNDVGGAVSCLSGQESRGGGLGDKLSAGGRHCRPSLPQIGLVLASASLQSNASKDYGLFT